MPIWTKAVSGETSKMKLSENLTLELRKHAESSSRWQVSLWLDQSHRGIQIQSWELENIDNLESAQEAARKELRMFLVILLSKI